METATTAMIALIMAISFRSLVALFVAGIATVSTRQVVAVLAGLLGIAVPADIEPLIVALLLGVVTTTACSSCPACAGYWTRSTAGEAVPRTTARTTPIVAVVGLTVAAGRAALVVTRSALFRGLGPGLALTVLVGLAVAITLVPAVLAVPGATVSPWPTGPGVPGPVGNAGLTFYVPFAAAVRLLSLGLDDNISAVGRV